MIVAQARNQYATQIEDVIKVFQDQFKIIGRRSIPNGAKTAMQACKIIDPVETSGAFLGSI